MPCEGFHKGSSKDIGGFRIRGLRDLELWIWALAASKDCRFGCFQDLRGLEFWRFAMPAGACPQRLPVVIAAAQVAGHWTEESILKSI